MSAWYCRQDWVWTPSVLESIFVLFAQSPLASNPPSRSIRKTKPLRNQILSKPITGYTNQKKPLCFRSSCKTNCWRYPTMNLKNYIWHKRSATTTMLKHLPNPDASPRTTKTFSLHLLKSITSGPGAYQQRIRYIPIGWYSHVSQYYSAHHTLRASHWLDHLLIILGCIRVPSSRMTVSPQRNISKGPAVYIYIYNCRQFWFKVPNFNLYYVMYHLSLSKLDTTWNVFYKVREALKRVWCLILLYIL